MNSIFSLRGCTVCLTGATGHLGSVMAKGLAEAGAHVIITARYSERLTRLASELCDKGLRVDAFPCDLAEEENRRALTTFLHEHVECLDVLVNNAYGAFPGGWQRGEIPDFECAQKFAVGVPYELVQKTLPLLERSANRRKGGASVVNISSMYGSVSPDPAIYGDSGLNSPPEYGAAKAGMLQLTRHLAVHLAPRQVRVNALSPGPFPREMFRANQPQFCATLASKVPLQRLGQADELLGPLIFLSSSASSYVTGMNMPVDGGWTAW